MTSFPWFISSRALAGSVAPDVQGIWRPATPTGHYADLPDQEEEELLTFLTNHPWREGLRARLSHAPWLSAIVTDPRRAAGVLRVPLSPGARVLDVGSGWGQLAVPLARRGHQVVALDQTMNRLRLLAAIAVQEGVACERLCGDIETASLAEGAFDLVVLNGVLEWTVRGRREGMDGASHQVDVLARCRDLLAPGGQIYMAIENALGLKYLMGSRDDHCGLPWVTLARESDAEAAWRNAGFPAMKARTQDLAGYRGLFARAGLQETSAWACFPDYKLPSHIVDLDHVDDFLLGDAEWEEHHGDNGESLPAGWPLREAYRRLARAHSGAVVAPSYAFVLSRPHG